MSQKLKTTYQETIVPKLKEQFGYTNIHQVPKVIKITVNRGLGEASQNAKALESSKAELSTITGQQPVVTRAKKAIAGFNSRRNARGCDGDIARRSNVRFFRPSN